MGSIHISYCKQCECSIDASDGKTYNGKAWCFPRIQLSTLRVIMARRLLSINRRLKVNLGNPLKVAHFVFWTLVAGRRVCLYLPPPPPSPKAKANVNKICVDTYQNVLNHIQTYRVLIQLLFCCCRFGILGFFVWCRNSNHIYSRGLSEFINVNFYATTKSWHTHQKVRLDELVRQRNMYGNIHCVIDVTVWKPTLVTPICVDGTVW